MHAFDEARGRRWRACAFYLNRSDLAPCSLEHQIDFDRPASASYCSNLDSILPSVSNRCCVGAAVYANAFWKSGSFARTVRPSMRSIVRSKFSTRARRKSGRSLRKAGLSSRQAISSCFKRLLRLWRHHSVRSACSFLHRCTHQCANSPRGFRVLPRSNSDYPRTIPKPLSQGR